jgi:hypothetical protein
VGVCPQCRRLSARCSAVPQEGSRCRAFNRPLACFCRYCREAFPDGWFAAALAADPAGHHDTSEAAAALHLGQPEPILRLGDLLDRQESATELREVAGRVWVGTSTGRFLLVEPFRAQQGDPLRRRPWSTGHLRVGTAGLWLVLWCEHGLQALDLLPFDAPAGQDFQLLPIWNAPQQQRIVADPVLLRLPDDPEQPAAALDRAVLWLTDGPGGPALWTALLSLNSERPSEPRRFPLPEIDRHNLVRLTEAGDLALVAAPVPGRDLALVRSRDTLSWITLKSNEPGDPIGTPRVVPALGQPADGRGFTFGTGRPDLPGLFFVPAAWQGSSDRQHLGQAFVAGRRDDEPERHDLYIISCFRTAAQSTFARLGEGIPLVLGGTAGAVEAVCLTTSGLRRYNELGMTTLHYDNPLLRGVQRVGATERVLACSGIDASTTQPRWFTTLVDLRTGRLIEPLFSTEKVPAPLLLGRELISVARLPTGQPSGATELFLARRSLGLATGST